MRRARADAWRVAASGRAIEWGRPRRHAASGQPIVSDLRAARSPDWHAASSALSTHVSAEAAGSRVGGGCWQSRRRGPACGARGPQSNRLDIGWGSYVHLACRVVALPGGRESSQAHLLGIREDAWRRGTHVSGVRRIATVPHSQTSQMPLGGSGGDENGCLTLDARITSCPAWAIFKGRSERGVGRLPVAGAAMG
jgi:hypothetical protein